MTTRIAHVWRDARPSTEGGIVNLYAISFPAGTTYDIRQESILSAVAELEREGWIVTGQECLPKDTPQAVQGYKPRGFSRLECLTCGACIIRSLKATKDHEASQQHQQAIRPRWIDIAMQSKCPRREGETLTDWTLRFLAEKGLTQCKP